MTRKLLTTKQADGYIDIDMPNAKTKKTKKGETMKKTNKQKKSNNNKLAIKTLSVLILVMILTNAKFVEVACRVLKDASQFNWILQLVVAIYVVGFIAVTNRKK